MNWLFTRCVLLLAERDIFRDFGSGFRAKKEQYNASHLLILIIVIIAAFAALSLVARIAEQRNKREVYHSPRGLFRSLCRLHRLSSSQRRLLRQLAKHHRLALPARLFLSPELLEPARLGPAWQDAEPILQDVRDRLFGREPLALIDVVHDQTPDDRLADREEEPDRLGEELRELLEELGAAASPGSREPRVVLSPIAPTEGAADWGMEDHPAVGLLRVAPDSPKPDAR